MKTINLKIEMSYENKTMNLKLENSYANGLKEQN